ncbi:MAG: peptidyl-prolyl cis-trans isomerase [Phycisphaerae bacterium]|nr:peptidyl-prolyl cis-trans isomerase [Phycisphaerae bacterium]MDP7286428.1 peptidyl-prolyl cis-trans isomerase [Phycisphaerae bacterium]
MKTTRITTTIVLAAFAAGLVGCTGGLTRFEWPWRRQSAPVTDAKWSSEKEWPKPVPDPNQAEPDRIETGTVSPDRGPATTAVKTAPDGEEPLQIGQTREIATSVISVKGKFITVQEILLEAERELAAVPSDVRFDSRVRQIIQTTIQRRVNHELIFAETESRLSEPQKAHVEAQVEEIVRGMIADVGGSRTKLDNLLAQRGVTLKKLKEEHRRSLTVQVYRQIKFLPAISITRQMLLSYYNKHKADFTVEKKVAMQIIAVLLNDKDILPKDVGSKPSPQELAKARSAALERIEKADKLLQGGADFGDVAKEFSSVKSETGGKLPLWPTGSLRQKEVEKAAFSLQQGQRSGIIESTLIRSDDDKIVNYGGYYIVKAYQVQEGKTTSFEGAQEEVARILRMKQLEVLSAKFSQRLANESRIPQSPDFLETAINEAIKIHWKPTLRQ